MRKLVTTVLLYAFLWPGAHADKPGDTSTPPTLVVGLIDFPPLSSYDADGQAEGTLVPLMQAVAREAGYQTEFRIMPLARLVQSMQEGSVHVWPGIPGRLDLNAHSVTGTLPLGQLHINLYHRPDTPTPRWPEDLFDKDLIVLTGYDYGAQLSAELSDSRLRLQRTHHHSAAIGMLLRGRANYLLNYQAPMDDALLQRPDVQLRHLPLVRLPLLLVVSTTARPGGAGLLQDLEQAYIELHERNLLPALKSP